MMQIGQKVRVHAKVEFGYVGDDKPVRKALRSKHEVTGYVVGAKYRRLGTYWEGHRYPMSPEDYEQPELHVTRTVFVYCVSQGLMRKPFDVLPFDLTKD